MVLEEDDISRIQPLVLLNLCMVPVRTFFVQPWLLRKWFGRRSLLVFLQLLQPLYDALIDAALVSEKVELLLLKIAHSSLQRLSGRLDARGLALEDVYSVESFGVCEGILFLEFYELVSCHALVVIDEQHRGGVLIDGHQRAAERRRLSGVGVRPQVILLWETVRVQGGEHFLK